MQTKQEPERHASSPKEGFEVFLADGGQVFGAARERCEKAGNFFVPLDAVTTVHA